MILVFFLNLYKFQISFYCQKSDQFVLYKLFPYFLFFDFLLTLLNVVMATFVFCWIHFNLSLCSVARWCLCAARWLEAYKQEMAPNVILANTHQRALEVVPLELLQEHAVTVN